MKKIGIAVDNYKVKRFTKALRKKEIEFKKLLLTANTTLITFQIAADRVNEISIMCKQLEIEIKHSN